MTIILTDHLLTPHGDLWETALYNSNSPWFADGSYLKDENDKYYAGYAIATPFEVIEATPLPSAELAQQTELYTIDQTCILAKGKTANIYTNSRYVGIAYDFRMLWKQQGFLTSSGDKIKNGLYMQKLLDAILLQTLWPVSRSLCIPNLIPWRLMETTSMTISAKHSALKGRNN